MSNTTPKSGSDQGQDQDSTNLTVFVIRNHENRYLTKKHKWRSGNNPALLYRSPERDVALNELIEVNAKDITARLELIACKQAKNKHPVVEVLTEDSEEDLAEDQADKASAEALAQLANREKPALELVQDNTQ